MGLADERHPGAGATAGADARRPSDIPRSGFAAVGRRVFASLRLDHVSLLAAGVAFKGLLALFPAIVAAITIWGLVADRATITRQMRSLTGTLPSGASQLLDDQMTQVASQGSSTLGVALAVSLLLALWSASAGMAGLVEGINAAYDEVDHRPFVRRRGLALLLTLGAIVGLLVTLGLIAVLPAALDSLGLGRTGELVVRIATWPVLAVLAIVGLAVLYKYSPDRDAPRTRWVTWGAVLATLLWLAGSALFTVFVENFGSFGETYGAFAGIIVLMLWLFLTAFVVLLGAEINSELERQTARDSTVGAPEPLGVRGAQAADTTPADWAAAQRDDRDDGGRDHDGRDEAADRDTTRTSGGGGLAGQHRRRRVDREIDLRERPAGARRRDES